MNLVIAFNAAKQVEARPDASVLLLISTVLLVTVLQLFGYIEDPRHLVGVIHLQSFNQYSDQHFTSCQHQWRPTQKLEWINETQIK